MEFRDSMEMWLGLCGNSVKAKKFVYVIGWMAVVFEINSASIVNRKE